MGDGHRPVLLDEVLDALRIRQDGLYVDGTFGRGGHAAAVLERLRERGRLLAFDKDPEALAFAADRFRNESPRPKITEGCRMVQSNPIAPSAMARSAAPLLRR